MSAARFRPAERRDLARLVALLAADPLGATREAPGEPLDPAYLDGFAAIETDPNQLLAVAETPEGAILGVMQLSFIPGLARKGAWRGQIEGVRVAEAARGSGLGGEMLEWAVEKCRERGCALVQLTSDKARPDAHRFYENHGFTASHEGFKRSL